MRPRGERGDAPEFYGVYVMTNPDEPGLIRVGLASTTPKVRSGQITKPRGRARFSIRDDHWLQVGGGDLGRLRAAAVEALAQAMLAGKENWVKIGERNGRDVHQQRFACPPEEAWEAVEAASLVVERTLAGSP